MENRRLVSDLPDGWAESGTNFKRQLQEYAGRMCVVETEKQWASDGQGSKWEETKSARYNASGLAEKCTHRLIITEPHIPLGPGQAHFSYERWGEIYDGIGYGRRIRYFEKWDEGYVDGGWEKWGNKWEVNFDRNGHGVKKEETRFEGRDGQHMNQTREEPTWVEF